MDEDEVFLDSDSIPGFEMHHETPSSELHPENSSSPSSPSSPRSRSQNCEDGFTETGIAVVPSLTPSPSAEGSL